MGASASKTGQAAGAAARQYPKRSAQAFNAANAPRSAPPQPAQQVVTPGPTVKPPPRASTTRDAAINLDASDPDLARHLRSIGPVQPNPTLSQTSTFKPGPSSRTVSTPKSNPAILVLEARARLQREADEELARVGKGGRKFLDAYTIRSILEQRDEQGRSAAEIEKSLSLAAGTVASLGPPGMNGLVVEQGRGRREVDMV